MAGLFFVRTTNVQSSAEDHIMETNSVKYWTSKSISCILVLDNWQKEHILHNLVTRHAFLKVTVQNGHFGESPIVAKVRYRGLDIFGI